MKVVYISLIFTILLTMNATAGGYASKFTVPGTLKVAITQNVLNEADSGMHGFWATEDYNKLTLISDLDGTAHIAIMQYVGRWRTYTGVLSPIQGIPQPRNGSGTFYGVYLVAFNSTGCITKHAKLETVDHAVTKEDIIAQTVEHETIEQSIATLCENVHGFAVLDFTFAYQNGEQSMTQNSNGIKGDIIT